jgi:predicted ribosomally synthesized peptide with nif11-like leader
MSQEGTKAFFGKLANNDDLRNKLTECGGAEDKIIALAQTQGCEVTTEDLAQPRPSDGELSDSDLAGASGGGAGGSSSTETLLNFLAHGGSDSGQKWLHIVNNMAANNPGAGPSVNPGGDATN